MYSINRRHTVILVVLAVLLALATGSVPVLGALTGLLVLLLPGITLTMAALAHRRSFRFAERILLGCGLQLLTLLAVGLVLARLNQVTRTGWVVGLGVVSIVASLVAVRRAVVPAFTSGETAESAVGPAATDEHLPPPRRSTLAWGALTGAFGVAALAVSAFSAQQAPREHYTELWAIPAAQRPVARPTATASAGRVAPAPIAGPARLDIGVRSQEAGTARYVVTLVEGRTQRSRWEIQLEPGQEWTTQGQTATPTTVAVRLQKVDATPNPYRQVTVSAQTRAAALRPPAPVR